MASFIACATDIGCLADGRRDGSTASEAAAAAAAADRRCIPGAAGRTGAVTQDNRLLGMPAVLTAASRPSWVAE